MPRKRKKPSTLAKLTRKVASRKRKRKPAPRQNPSSDAPMWDDVGTLVIPGLVAYASTRAAGRIIYKLAVKKSPTYAKHAGPWGSVALALLGWWLVNKYESLAKYHTPVVVGASVAAIQGLLQTYVPQYGWILNDYHMDDVLPRQAAMLPESNGEPATALPEPEPTADDLDLEAVLNDGEGIDDLYTGAFAR